MKQTAVEWLMPKILELTLQLSLRKISARNCELEVANLFDQAKAMEKEQINQMYKEWFEQNKKTCYHPLTERKHTSDIHFECTICGYNNY